MKHSNDKLNPAVNVFHGCLDNDHNFEQLIPSSFEATTTARIFCKKCGETREV